MLQATHNTKHRRKINKGKELMSRNENEIKFTTTSYNNVTTGLDSSSFLNQGNEKMRNEDTSINRTHVTVPNTRP